MCATTTNEGVHLKLFTTLVSAAAIIAPLTLGACDDADVSEPTNPSGGACDFVADIWVDNWFAMYVDDALVGEDSVPITTERSFNKESFCFEATYPFTLNFIVKDYKADDSGLEYIGQAKQQMGDGGFIAQFKDASGSLVAVTDSSWKCKVIHEAPLNPSCEKDADPSTTCQFSAEDEPQGWKASGYDTSAWPNAVEHSEAAVSPKDGYDEVNWDSTAKIIWGSDLETHNTLLCTKTVTGP